MRGRLYTVGAAAIVLLAAAVSLAADLEVSQPTQITGDTHYERGNSAVKFSYDGYYYLFYARSEDFEGNYGSGNPDNHHYVIYYKKAATVAGLAGADAELIDNMPTTGDKIYQGQTSCVEYDGDLWVFAVDMGDGGGQVKAWTSADGDSWTVSDVLPSGTDPFEGSHLWATVYDGEIFLAVNRGGNIDITTYNGTLWSAFTQVVDHEGMPRLYVDGSGPGTLYFYYCSWGLPSYYIYEYSAGPIWTLRAEITGTDDDDCDPILTKLDGDYIFIFAPWNSGDSKQFLKHWTASAIVDFDGLTQTTTKLITAGGYGGTNWVDMWPATLTDGSDVYMFYGSEADGTERGTGNIFMLEIDWDLDNDHYCYIQNAINAASGTTVNVAAGTYNEQVRINKSLTVDGSGYVLIDPDGAEFEGPKAGADTVRAAVTFETGSTGATLMDVTIENSNASSLNGNAGIEVIDGGIDDVTIQNVVVNDVTGQGFGSYDTDYTWPPPSGWVIDGCSFSTLGTNTSGMRPQNMDDLTIENCDVGPTQYGGILLINVNVGAVTDCKVHDTVRAGIQVDSYCTDTIDVLGNEVWATNSAAASDYGDIRLYAQYTPDPHGDPPAVVTIESNLLRDGYNGLCVKSGQDISTRTVHANYNAIVNHTNYGALNAGTGTLDAKYTWWGDESGPNTSDGSGDKVSAGVDYDPWIGKAGGENIVCDPNPKYLTVAAPAGTVGVKYLGGGGGLVYGYSVKFSWDGAIASTDETKVSQGGLLSAAGTTFFDARPSGANEITVDCALLGAEPGVTGSGTMFTIEFTGVAVGASDIDVFITKVRDKDNESLSGFYEEDGELIVDVQAPTVSDVVIENLTLGHTDDYIKNTDTARVTATVQDDDPAFGKLNITADLEALGGGTGVNPDLYDGTTATWTDTLMSVVCDPPDGTVTVTVSATDPIGNPATPSSGNITSDNTPPTAVTDLDAGPGHEECDLTWTNGTDDHLYGVTVRRNTNAGEYPTYPLFVANWPNVDTYYPGDETSGVDVYTGAIKSAHTDGVVDRNIYYYQAFCYDIVLLYGPAATTARDLATNYWLGDVASAWGVWGYNGLVNDSDIDKLGGPYGAGTFGQPAPTGNDAECDVGPTVHPDAHRLGLPKPDTAVEFEDLMIFAMNYGVVSARVLPLLPDPAVESLALVLVEVGEPAGEELVLTLRLEGNAGEVKGLNAVVSYDSAELEFVSARLSEEMTSPLARVFFWHGEGDGTVKLDLAVLGTGVTIGGSGDVATLTFSVVGDGDGKVDLAASLRGAGNEELDAELEGYEPTQGLDLPTVFRLVQNVPNPFNPATVVAYHVPETSRVSICVYNVAGQLVRTLVDGDIEPGHHTAIWDGRNDAGDGVGSGVYLCTMDAGEFHASHKMLLLK